MKGFASDNYAGVHPAVLDAIVACNAGHFPAYGNDDFTTAAKAAIRSACGAPDAAVELFCTGTGANCAALQLLCGRSDAVMCAASAHINVDEGGAPERLLGLKLITVPTADGKLTPELVRKHAVRRGDVHYAFPKAVSITQPTEWGTIYSVEDMRALSDAVHELGMFLHVDGARLSNAAAALGVPIAAITSGIGADVVSFGGTKNGLMAGEAVVVLNRDPGMREMLPRAAKQLAQMASKQRFVGAGFTEMFGTDLWWRNARHANAMARRLSEGIAAIPGWRAEIVQPTKANAVFARLPQDVIQPLQEEFHFYTWDEDKHIVRLMCSWDTTEDEVDAFLRSVREAVGAGAGQAFPRVNQRIAWIGGNVDLTVPGDGR
ncbi:aromatic amino acid beta-eliminating lyase/threonine aldolase [Hyaloraphidium curvatum]|nr:aromatic amino acid beta-eliminating lyase/threonine aldolase [Hyaloraphidium curvatum]